MNEYVALCVTCRKLFTEAELAKATTYCPNCGSVGVPADPKKTSTITLTHHEWRILCIWAHNYGESLKKPFNTIDAIVGEMHRQDPDLPPLTMNEEMIKLKTHFPDARLIRPVPLTRAEELLARILHELPPNHYCNNLAHTKEDLHDYDQDCPLLQRLNNAIEEAEAYLKARQTEE